MEGVTISEVVLDIKSSTVTIKKLVIEDSRFCADLAGLDDEGRKNFVRRALQMGAVALRVMDTTSRVDYVRGEFNGMQTRFEMELERIFSDKGSLLMTMDARARAARNATELWRKNPKRHHIAPKWLN